MSQPVLFLMVGYPGSGKTTASLLIHDLTGAVHLWADKIRRERFGEPQYTHAETAELYNHMNELAGELLRAGNSVIFDTNFGFKKDRDHLREIADQHRARTVVVWRTTPLEISKSRAINASERKHTRVIGDELGNMPEATFDRLAGELEPPTAGEQPIKLGETDLTKEVLRHILQNQGLL